MSSSGVDDGSLSLNDGCLAFGEPRSDAATPSAFPASPDGGAGIAGPEGVASYGGVPAPIDSCPPLRESAISQPFPLPSTSDFSLPTPEFEAQPDLGLSFAASVFPTANVSLPTTPIVKGAHNLRLPSFDVLGIASPHPDRIALRTSNSFSLGVGPLSKPEDPLHALSPPLAQQKHSSAAESGHPAASPETSRAHMRRLVPTVTPPTEPGSFNWGTFVNVRAAGVGSPPSSDPGVSPNIQTTASASSPAPPIMANTLSVVELSDALDMAAWVERAKEIITSECQSLNLASIKVLSHALPCPSLTGHLFAQIIAAIHERSATPTAWINVFHAVPGRFTLSDLPKSPPSTPGPAVGGDEYFTSKVFDSAVAVPDYQLDSKLLPPSPRPVVPPGSVNVSVVERYIPATNINEFAEMFQIKGRSLLYDRLVELSPKKGLLLFIYPTRSGARTFVNRYLGPVLDPLLRSITVVHELSSDLGKSLGQMAAVEHLVEYNTLRAEVERFCATLSESSATLTTSPERRSTYSVIYASREETVLERQVWASDWWIKQEKPRVREVVSKYFRKKLPGSELTTSTLIQDVLDGVAHREYPIAGGPPPVEVGVFVIQRSS